MTGQSLRYLALGDSYTIGEGVPEPARWPVQLVEVLRAEGWPVKAPEIIATTGWTTDELNAGIDAQPPRGEFDLVSLAIGVNNQYRGCSLQEYGHQFTALLDRAIGFAGGRAGRVLVLSIPDWGCTPFAIAQQRAGAVTSEQIDAFNTAAAQACTAQGVRFIDVTGLSRQYGMEPAMLVDDGLHPSAAMYALWTELAHRAARDALA